MKVLNNNKGITMLVLVITMVILFILVSIAVYSSRGTTNEAKFSATYATLRTVKEACENAENLIEVIETNGSADSGEIYDEFYFFGNTITEEGLDIEDLKTRCGLYSFDSFSDRTYLIEDDKNSDADKRRLEHLEIRNLSVRVVADLDNKCYYVLDGVSRKDGKKVYELRDFILGYDALVK